MKKINKLVSSIVIGTGAIGMLVPMISSLSSCGHTSKFAQTAEMLKNDAIQIFKDICCSVRHNSGNLRAILDIYKTYLNEIGLTNSYYEQPWTEYQDEAIKKGTKESFFQSKYGNAYFDIPAAQGCDSWEPVILQGHVDMVESGFPLDPKVEHPIKVVEKLVNGKKTLQTENNATSLGADNGAGIALMLAIAKNRDKFQHGKIRCLLSADEEPGMVGAGYVPELWFDGFNNVINIDNEAIGEIVISCAGGYSQEFEVPTVQELLDNGFIEEIDYGPNQIYKITIDNLKASHSADVTQKMSNGIQLVTGTLSYLFQGIENQIRLLALDTPETSVTNAIVTKGTATYVDGNGIIYSQDQINKFEKAATNWIKENYPEETNPRVEIQTLSNAEFGNADKHYVLTNSATLALINIINKFMFGPISYLDQQKTILESSSNVGPIHVYINGEASSADIPAISLKFYSRSCNNQIMTLIQNYNATLADAFKNAFIPNTGTTIGKIHTLAEFPGWAPAENDPMVEAFVAGYKDAGVEPKKMIIHGGVEPAWWVNKKVGIHAACIGPTIEGCHTKDETLYIDTFFEESEALLYALNTLKK